MAGIGQFLSNYRGIPAQQLLCVFNPVAGSGVSAAFADELQGHLQSGFRFQENRYETSLLPTVEDRYENIAAIAQKIDSLTQSQRPLTILTMGGDGTLDLVISGYLTTLFGSLNALPGLEQARIIKRLKESHVRLGIVRSGSANDVGTLYGSPKPKVGAATEYLAKSVDANLHLGMAMVHHEDRNEVWPFVHSFAAGHVFTPILVDANAGGRRGREAMRWMLRHGLGRIFKKADKRTMHWKRSDGSEGEMAGQDAMAHALPRLAIAVALPGLTPFEGVGFKIVPETGLAARLLIGAELFGSGLLSRMGRLVPLSASARLATVPESHQMMLNVGEWIEFHYTDSDGRPTDVGYQVSGDGIGYTKGPIRIQALPPFERFLMTPGAPIGRLLYKNLVDNR